MHVRGRHMGWTHLLVCALVILAALVGVGFFGFDAAWVIIAVAFCAVMMVSMIWMMVAMGRGAMHRR